MWPEKAEFVRAAAKFGAKIVPFCGVGEDDFLRVSTLCIYVMCNIYIVGVTVCNECRWL